MYSQPSTWSYANTGMNHSILLAGNIQFKIDEQQASTTDTWIGVFYTNSSGELKCGGYYQWFGYSTSKVSVSTTVPCTRRVSASCIFA